MLWAATVYGAGIVIGYYVWRPPLCWLMAAITFSASRAYFLRRRSQSGLCPCSSYAKLEQAHVIAYRTDMDGAVTFYLDSKTVTSQLAAPR
jgi:hypothetical protein